MNQPSVCAVTPFTNARLLAQAVKCFNQQTYGNRRMRVQWNNGQYPIGELRNNINTEAHADIIFHFDSDDWSHPNRIAEQVALLQSSGADVVGYNEMLFWREQEQECWLYTNGNPHWALGTSLCYWRKTWEQKPFPEINHGEDTKWLQGLKVMAVTTLRKQLGDPSFTVRTTEPRMVARIHAGNAGNNAYNPAEMAKASEWRRCPDFDSYCKGVFHA